MARALLRLGVAPGDRVGILAPKSAASVIGIYGVLKAGACYVPLDPKAPRQRLSYVVRDSAAAVIVADDARAAQAAALAGEALRGLAASLTSPPGGHLDVQAEECGRPGRGAAIVPWTAVAAESAEPLPEERSIETDLAYILYTSGSTGTPKGVMISHRNSLGFVEWAAAAAGLTEAGPRLQPRAAAFRPVGLRHLRELPGRRLPGTVIPDGVATFPVTIAQWLEKERISVWYSVPSVLTLLGCYGNLPKFDLSAPASGDLRRGGVPAQVPGPADGRAAASPLPQLVRADRDERVHGIRGPAGRADSEPVPIGKACANTEVFAVTSEGGLVSGPGEVGELYVRGPVADARVLGTAGQEPGGAGPQPVPGRVRRARVPHR